MNNSIAKGEGLVVQLATATHYVIPISVRCRDCVVSTDACVPLPVRKRRRIWWPTTNVKALCSMRAIITIARSTGYDVGMKVLRTVLLFANVSVL